MESRGERHVVVTGGGRGIGRAIAERLAAEGATLTLLARDLERLRPVADELGADAAACDIRDQTRDEAFDEAMREVPLLRMSEPADIAGTMRWLLSADSRGVTGQAIDQNGGAWVG